MRWQDRVCGVVILCVAPASDPVPLLWDAGVFTSGWCFFFASMTTGNVALLSRFPFDVYPTLHFSLLLSISFSLSVQFAPFLPLLPTCLTAEENEQRKRDERETRVSVLGGGGDKK